MEGRLGVSVKIKVGGIASVEDARAAARTGVDYWGVIFAASSVRRVGLDVAARIAAEARGVSGKVKIVGVFTEADFDFVRRAAAEVGLDVVQLHFAARADFIEKAKSLAEVWSVHWLCGEEDVAGALESRADCVLLDAKSGGKCGGTGCVADWRLAREVSDGRRTILAGGLSPSNMRECLESVPNVFGLDFNSGVEVSPAVKDIEKISQIINLNQKL